MSELSHCHSVLVKDPLVLRPRRKTSAFAVGLRSRGGTRFPTPARQISAQSLRCINHCRSIVKEFGLFRPIRIKHQKFVRLRALVAVDANESHGSLVRSTKPKHHRGLSGSRPYLRQPPAPFHVQSCDNTSATRNLKRKAIVPLPQEGKPDCSELADQTIRGGLSSYQRHTLSATIPTIGGSERNDPGSRSRWAHSSSNARRSVSVNNPSVTKRGT